MVIVSFGTGYESMEELVADGWILD